MPQDTWDLDMYMHTPHDRSQVGNRIRSILDRATDFGLRDPRAYSHFANPLMHLSGAGPSSLTSDLKSVLALGSRISLSVRSCNPARIQSTLLRHSCTRRSLASTSSKDITPASFLLPTILPFVPYTSLERRFVCPASGRPTHLPTTMRSLPSQATLTILSPSSLLILRST